MVGLSRAERDERRADVIAHRVTVVQAYRSGRSLARVADDWEVGESWLEATFRAWGEQLRPENRPGRVRTLALASDVRARIVLVRPKPDAAWRLPGGWARASEPIAEVAARDLLKQTGVVRALTHVAVLGQGPASQAGGGHLVVVFAATLTDQETELLATSRTAGRLCAVPPDDLDDYALPYDARLVRAAVDAVRRGATLPLLPLDDLTPA